MSYDEASLEVVRRALEKLGVSARAVPPSFPLELADYLRGKRPHRHRPTASRSRCAGG